MAEIAIPLIALGGMYVISNQDKENKEGYVNAGQNPAYLPGVIPPTPAINYPKTLNTNKSNPKIYKNANQTTDRFYNEKVYNDVEKTQNNFSATNSVGGGTQEVNSLTGEVINKDNFKHNNMVPFFGAKIKGSTNDGLVESRLDNMQGNGSQLIRKKELAPLFQPHNNLQYAHGAPNASDFIQSRVNPSMKQSNVLPWEQEKVAPGLGKGFTSGGGAGFNNGMEDRNSWLPKTVNELRVDTNPKMTFGLEGHQGPSTAYVKDYASVKQQGKVEKYAPDTYYNVGPDRWFTTTGLEKAQTAHSNQMLHEQNRQTTSCQYFGDPNGSEATYAKGEYAEARRPVLSATDTPGPSRGGLGQNTVAREGYNVLPNNRSTTKNELYNGGVNGIVKAVVAPLLDVFRTTKKENVIGSVRQSGNMQNNGTGWSVWNPADRTKTTIKETTLGPDQLYVQGHDGVYDGGYLVNPQQAIENQRDTTNCEYVGNTNLANGVPGPRDEEAAYRQRNNANKVTRSYTPGGYNQIFNQEENVCLRQDCDRLNNRIAHVQSVISAPPSTETYGKINTPQYYNECIGCERINPDILTAFKNNPYTQSLSSY